MRIKVFFLCIFPTRESFLGRETFNPERKKLSTQEEINLQDLVKTVEIKDFSVLSQKHHRQGTLVFYSIITLRVEGKVKCPFTIGVRGTFQGTVKGIFRVGQGKETFQSYTIHSSPSNSYQTMFCRPKVPTAYSCQLPNKRYIFDT